VTQLLRGCKTSAESHGIVLLSSHVFFRLHDRLLTIHHPAGGHTVVCREYIGLLTGLIGALRSPILLPVSLLLLPRIVPRWLADVCPLEEGLNVVVPHDLV
jgi:hypothetical protein